MNALQHVRQARYLLLGDTWEDSPSERVFGQPGADGTGGAVLVTAGPSEEALDELRAPFALLYVDESEADPEEPALLTQNFGLILAAAVEGDRYGERAITGGPRDATAGQGGSYGRGILEVEAKVRARIGKLTGADGAPCILRHTGAAATTRSGDMLVALRKYAFQAMCTAAPTFTAPQDLVATGGAGQVVLTWTLPPARFDRLAVILRRATGATPPATATSGTDVPVAADAVGVTDSGLAAGTYSYALFESYDETGSGSAQRYSSQETGTTRASVSVS